MQGLHIASGTTLTVNLDEEEYEDVLSDVWGGRKVKTC